MRYALIDEIRGFTLVSMLLYHACWDLVYIFHVKASWYESLGAYCWQQSICISFILLSGFCWHLGRRKVMHGVKLFLGGAVITAVTLLFMPEDRVVFGVLTFLGSAALIVCAGERIAGKQKYGALISFLFFVITRNVNQGYLGIGALKIVRLPRFLYRNHLTALIGFPPPSFYSTDYFSIIPWFFLYMTGYYVYILMRENDTLKIFDKSICPPLGVIGRHSFWIYMVHQPVLYAVLFAGTKIFRV